MILISRFEMVALPRWTGDFILASPEGTPVEEEKWIIGEFNCSCVGVSKCLPASAKSAACSGNWGPISEVG